MFGGVKINTIFASYLKQIIMSKKLDYQTIELYGVKLTLGYTEEGRYIPATRETPEEQPDLVIHEITADGDIKDLLENYIETIYELLNDKI